MRNFTTFGMIYRAFTLVVLCLTPAFLSADGEDPRGCTIVTISQNGRTFFGGNDDYHNLDSVYWISPGSSTTNGGIYFGHPDNVQQGFNERGLAYDANGLPSMPIVGHTGTTPGPARYTHYSIAILESCATVEEVITWVQTHEWHAAMHDQMHFADATGDAVVIGVGRDGRVAFTRKSSGNSYLVSTNFNLVNPGNGSYPCSRHKRATGMAAEIIGNGSATVTSVANIMERTHVETPSVWTLYSLVADLNARTVSVYFMFSWDKPITLHIDSELERVQGERYEVALSSLFPEDVRENAEIEIDKLRNQRDVWSVVGILWVGMIPLWLLLSWRLHWIKTSAASIFTIIILGPIGLVLSGFENRISEKRKGAESGSILKERFLTISTAPILASIVVSLAAGLNAIYLVASLSDAVLPQILILVIAPAVVALLVVPLLLTTEFPSTTYWRRFARLSAPVISVSSCAQAILLPIALPASLLIVHNVRAQWMLPLTILASSAIVSLLPAGLLFTYANLISRFGPVIWLLPTAAMIQRDRRTALIAAHGFRARPWYGVLWIAGALLILIAGIVATTQTILLLSR
jgi:hypothetical protein